MYFERLNKRPEQNTNRVSLSQQLHKASSTKQAQKTQAYKLTAKNCHQNVSYTSDNCDKIECVPLVFEIVLKL